MNESEILDKNGKPFKKKDLVQELPGASVTGIRQPRITESVANGLSPERLASALQAANEGHEHDLLSLAEEMEERSPRYASALSTRKLAIQGLPIVVEAASDDPRDKEIAEALERDIVKPSQFDELIEDLCDGLGKGRSTSGINWNLSQTPWRPSEYVWQDPRWIQTHPEKPNVLCLKDEADLVNGIPLDDFPRRYITHIPKLKTGIVSRAGLMRLVAVHYMCSNFALGDWMAFLELFGLPIRIGRYGNGASEDDKRILKQAVASIGSDAAAIMPESMRIEFEQIANAGASEQVFERILNYLDKQIDIAILGQTGTTEGTPGQLGNNDAQSEVRGDLLKADAKQMSRTLNKTVVRWYVDLNFGQQEHYPDLSLYVEEPEDMKLLVEAVTKLVPFGFRVKATEFYKKLNLTEPEEGDEILQQSTPANADPVGQENPAPPDTELNRASTSHGCGGNCPTCNTTSINKKQPGDDDIDELVDEALNDWQRAIDPVLTPIEQLAAESQDLEEFKARLPELLEGGMEAEELINQLAAQTMKAKALGDAGK